MSTTMHRGSSVDTPVSSPAVLSGVATAHLSTRALFTLAFAVFIAMICGTLSLSSILLGGGWLTPSLLTIAGIIGLCTALTSLRVPLFFIPIGAGITLLCIVTALFCDNGTWRVIPNSESLGSLRGLINAGQLNVNQYAPPVPVSPGLSCLIALSVGAVAAVVYLLTVNLRLPTWACIPVLALYIVPAFVTEGGAALWSFFIVMTGCLILLATDQRVAVALWGNATSSSVETTIAKLPSGLSVTAVGVGVVSLVAAVITSLILPGLSDSALNWFNAQHALNASADEDTSSLQPIALDPLVSLRRDLLHQPNGVMFTYATDNPTPGYLRTAVLNAYNGETFFPIPAGTGLAPETPEAVALLDLNRTPTGWTYTFVDKQLASPYLPVPENIYDIQTNQSGWLIDPSTLQVSGANTRGSIWTVAVGTTVPTPEALRAAPNIAADEQRNLLTNIPVALRDQAQLLTKDSATKYDAAIAIQQWLRNSFTYSTDVKSDESASYLTQFLQDRKGYCEQFAATMALMARAVGIPSRVIVGFTSGTKQRDGSWSVSPHQAHAWPELFLGQWVRFEPTPRAQVDGSAVSVPPYSVPQTVRVDTTKTEPQQAVNARNRRGQDLLRDKQAARKAVDLGPAATATQPSNPDQWRWIAVLIIGLLALAAAITPAVRRWWRRRVRLHSGEVEQAWDELRDSARDLGIPWSDASTPRQVAATMISAQHLTDDAAEAARRLCRVAEQTRYARHMPRTGRVAEDVRTVRHALLSRMDRRTRMQATWRPASLRVHSDINQTDR